MATREVIERSLAAVEAAGGNRSQAAKALGIHQRTLERHIAESRRDDFATAGTLANELRLHGELIDDVHSYWLKTDDASIYFRRADGPSYEEIRDALIEEMIGYAPRYTKIDYPEKTGEQHLLIIDPADVHIGKLVNKDMANGEYNIEIAVERLKSACAELAYKAARFNVERIILVIGNDILHVDNNNGTTTRGTRQDTDGKFWQMYLAAKKAYIEIVEHLALFAPVTIVFCPSNHDYASGWMLADSIYSWFNHHPNVSFGQENHNIDLRDRKYIVYGQNLIGFTHGDGAKESDLQQLMQYEAREAWGQTSHAYMYTHHLHHKIKNIYGKGGKSRVEKDYPGITTIHTGLARKAKETFIVETIRSPAPSDEWHAKQGYMNEQAIEAFLHHPVKGQVCRFTEWF